MVFSKEMLFKVGMGSFGKSGVPQPWRESSSDGTPDHREVGKRLRDQVSFS